MSIKIAVPRQEKYPTGKLFCGQLLLRGLFGEVPDERGFFEKLIYGATLYGSLRRSIETRSHGIDSGSMWGKSDEECVAFLKRQLDCDRFVVLLIAPPAAGHWISVYGYDGDTFYLHDPRLEFPQVSDLPVGNTTITGVELMKVWRKGPFYRWFLRWPKRLYISARFLPT